MESDPTSSTLDRPTTDVPPPPSNEEQQSTAFTSPTQAPTSQASNENREQTEERKEKDRKIAQLTAKIATLNDRIAEAEAERDVLLSKLKTPSATHTIKTHIHLLHTYNEIRDVGTGLMGLIAEKRGVRIKTVFEELGVAGED